MNIHSILEIKYDNLNSKISNLRMAVTNKLVLFMVVSSIIVLLRQNGYGDYYGGGYGAV
jgi:hypothetical protein